MKFFGGVRKPERPKEEIFRFGYDFRYHFAKYFPSSEFQTTGLSDSKLIFKAQFLALHHFTQVIKSVTHTA